MRIYIVATCKKSKSARENTRGSNFLAVHIIIKNRGIYGNHRVTIVNYHHHVMTCQCVIMSDDLVLLECYKGAMKGKNHKTFVLCYECMYVCMYLPIMSWVSDLPKSVVID